MGFQTDAVHAGQKPEPLSGAITIPIYQTSTYHQEELGKHKGYEYGRTHNPTREAMEINIATLEKGKYGIAFSSGLASLQALMGMLKQGDHVVISDNVYGGTFRQLEDNMTNYGLSFSWVDTSNLGNIENAITDKTKMLYIETPTNPMLNLTDIVGAVKIAKAHKLVSVVDNTFMSPYFQNPLVLGADIILHSTTKYINGHCDVVGGILITSNEQIHERLRYLQNAIGSVPSPFDCWLTLRSTKTLALRMKQHNENAIKIADYLEGQSYAEKVIYPGLKSHPQHELAKKQMTGFGGMISVDFGSFDKARKILNGVKVFSLAESLGGVESLICHPASMTHASVPQDERNKLGITESLVRFSVGVEDVEDLVSDIEQAVNS